MVPFLINNVQPTIESIIFHEDIICCSSSYDGFFNWTITYRQDADFRNQYGVIKQIKEHPSKGDMLQAYIKDFGIEHSYISQNKTKKVAWFVSHCDTKSEREKYVKHLQNYINVSKKIQKGGFSMDLFT